VVFKLIVIAGPCSIESEELTYSIARKLQQVGKRLGVEIIFKASFDKANRLSSESYRSIGLEKSIDVFDSIKKELGMRITTDIHDVREADVVARSIDIIQIPAFLCRQTDLLVEAAKTGRIVNIKKGQFLSPWNMHSIHNKIKGFGNEVWFTERGTTFGYGDLVVDMRSFEWMKGSGAKLIFDATHSVQKPGAQGNTSGGTRELVPLLARAAVASGIDGLFFEVHPDPDSALSDGPNMVPLDTFEIILNNLLKLDELVKSQNYPRI
jgi:2-dehydro-3-deoxyphosphooctonate aldolase (KDO 8-P synthase)